jgi:hypothetical protein
MHRALYLAVRKHGRQSLVAAKNCNNLASRLYVTEQHKNINVLIYTGADPCVYPVPVFDDVGRRLVMSCSQQMVLS